MLRYQQADGAAVDALVAKLSPQFFQFFFGQVRDRARAEDVLQDFWLRIHSARHTYRSTEPALPWMYAIARRVSIDQYRKRRRIGLHETQMEVLPDYAASVPPPAIDHDFQKLVAELPDAQREVILLLKVSGLSLEEVAQATGNTLGGVKQKAHRAYLKLRQILEISRSDQARRRSRHAM